MLSKLGWYWRRARCMPTAEVGHRLLQFALFKGGKRGFLRTTSVRPPDVGCLADMHGCVAPEGVDADRCIAEAERILSGRVSIFASPDMDVGIPPNWNRDPKTGVVAPLIYGPELAITDKSVVGEIKYAWEFNRHLHLVRLAQAYLLTGDRRYLDGLADQLRSWLDQCPPCQGPNWSSCLELGIRLINWFLIWRLIGGISSPMLRERPELLDQWFASIYAHCAFIARHRSAYSSANNHLIGEVAGLFVAATAWPCWPEAAKWADLAQSALEREARIQFFPDGTNREQATSYQIFSSEFLLIAAMQGDSCGRTFSADYWITLGRSADFIRSFTTSGGSVPMFGDADDGAVWQLEHAGSDRAKSFLDACNVACGRSVTPTFSDSAKWLHTLFGTSAVNRLVLSSGRNQFVDGGYYLFGSDFGGQSEVKGIVDCGPLGYLGIAAHGHADALSVLLSVGGEECLVDPGTYSYWQDLKWRDYFRGTSAHNTLRIDGSDQSVSGGRFMWTRKANCNIESLPSSPDRFEFVGTHDGYRRLGDPVVHRRSVKFDGDSRVLEIEDVAKGKGTHLFEQFWHFAPDIEVGLNGGNSAVIAGKKFKIHVTFFGDSLHLDMYRGSEEPVLGWYSAGYETKQACTSLRVSTTAHALQLRAVFSIQQTNAL